MLFHSLFLFTYLLFYPLAADTMAEHNAYPGGQNVSILHLDGNCLNASLMIEDTGEFIVKDGKWAL